MKAIIRKARVKDILQLEIVGRKAFYNSHKDAITGEIMENYLAQNFNEKQLLKEIENPNFEYHVLYYKGKLAGYSKVILNTKNENIDAKNVTKMERLYLSEEHHGLGLGKLLFDFNINLIKKNNQVGTWLYVWIRNEKALKFYRKTGFKNIANYDFPVSETETRPNYIMYLAL